jgi:hypothetical protein
MIETAVVPERAPPHQRWPKYRKSGGRWSFLTGISKPSALKK